MRTLLLAALLAPAALGQGGLCGLVKPEEAATLLGAPGEPMAVGNTGCSYSNRARGLLLTLTVLELDGMARQTWDGLRNRSANARRLVSDEAGMGSIAYSELIRRGAQNAAGRCGFVVVKGGKVVQVFVSDSPTREDIAGKRAMLDRLRPIARKIVGRM